MTATEWCIEIERRGTADDGRPLYSCKVRVLPRVQYCNTGTCSHYVPAYSADAVIATVRGILDDIRHGQWKRPDKPLPAADNTDLVDETGEFAMDDFFDRGTLAAFMSPEADA